MELINPTGLPGQFVILPDRDGYETLVVVLKGTFRIQDGQPAPVEEQTPIVQADEFYGKPGQSSPCRESDLALFKPATDVVLIGHAYAPRPNTKESLVSLSLGALSLSATIFGKRHWSVTLGLPRVQGPEPFETIPLRFENSFGGTQPNDEGDADLGCEERNPVGTGYVKERRRAYLDGLALPNIEHPKKHLSWPGQTPPPVCFGYVGRHWLPRRQFLGTYDVEWEKNRMPLLPADFDDRAFCGAPAALQASPHLRGGEPVEVVGVQHAGPLRFQLPALHPEMEVHFEGNWRALEPLLDTVVIEPDAARVSLTWRSRWRLHKKIRALKAVRLKVAP